MTDAIYAIFGASGFGREVMPLAREQLVREGVSIDQLVFVDDCPQDKIVNGCRVLTYEGFLRTKARIRYVALAIANGRVRQKLAEKLFGDGVILWQIFASNLVIMDQVEIAEGCILCPFVTLTSNINIGKCFHANIYSYVAHDCHIGNYVTFAPSVKCNGNVIIEDQVYIGTGAVIKQGRVGQPLVIGRNAVVGMGAVVTKDVQAGATVVGIPAAPIKKKLC